MNEDARDGNSPTGQALGNLALLVAAPLTIAGGLYGGYRLSKAGVNAAKKGATKFAESNTAKKIVEGMSQDGTKYGSETLKKETNRILEEIKLKKGDNITHNDIRDATMEAKQNVWGARKEAKKYKKENNISETEDFDFGDLNEATEEKRRNSRHRASDDASRHQDSAFHDAKFDEDGNMTSSVESRSTHTSDGRRKASEDAKNPNVTTANSVVTDGRSSVKMDEEAPRVGPTLKNAETHTPSNEPKYGPTLRNAEHPELATVDAKYKPKGVDHGIMPEGPVKTKRPDITDDEFNSYNTGRTPLNNTGSGTVHSGNSEGYFRQPVQTTATGSRVGETVQGLFKDGPVSTHEADVINYKVNRRQPAFDSYAENKYQTDPSKFFGGNNIVNNPNGLDEKGLADVAKGRAMFEELKKQSKL